MMTDTELRAKGLETLIRALGELNAERFIALLLREPFDYTKWQRDLWQDEDVAELSAQAMRRRLQRDSE
ncbi:MAG: hypothetical protein GYA30_11920 [Chloroflexi bacterium]|nr:hypothetical protein [Chloroflexota bacterium]OQA98376.1 MAG: hypothetical protein BWY25_02031 [Chloroflexi bacterium ADurb.Bin222]HOS79412.1 hypothetical protein [Anaerolineae bacterium]